jgi:uncharacterized protein (TIGR03083 family)
MNVDEWHDAREREGAAFLAAVRSAPRLDEPVPSCPNWSRADLTYHIGGILHFWTSVVRDEVKDPTAVAAPARPDDAGFAAWFDEQLAEANRVLRSSDPAGACWSWSHQHDIAFVIRRTAHELAVHRWDMEGSLGEPAPIDAPLASDGIDEFLEHFLDWRRDGSNELGGTVHIHCTDTAGEWLIVQDGDRLTVTREHAKGSCALRGPASDLLLVMWRRLPVSAIDVVGDADVAARFVDWTSLN